MVFEDNKIYPPFLGRKIQPPEASWGPSASIGNLPSVAGFITDRSLLPQLLRGEVRPIGREGEWLEVRPIGRSGEWLQAIRASLANRPSVHEVSHFSQSVRTNVRNRINAVRGRMSAQGLDKIIPPAWGPSSWPIGASIASLPSVMGIGFRNTRTMHPQLNKGERVGRDGSYMSVEQDQMPVTAGLGTNFSVSVE